LNRGNYLLIALAVVGIGFILGFESMLPSVNPVLTALSLSDQPYYYNTTTVTTTTTTAPTQTTTAPIMSTTSVPSTITSPSPSPIAVTKVNWTAIIAVIVVLLVIGFIVGYLLYRGRKPAAQGKPVT